ncbi:MAG: glycosyltransferase family 9 protein, partial [Opitutaceae bacterium]
PLIVVPYPLSPYEPWTDDVRRRVAWWAAFLRAGRWDASLLALVNRNWVGDFTVALAPAATRLGFAANPTRQPLMNEAGALAGPNAPKFTTEIAPSFTRREAEQLRDLFALLEPRLGPAAVWRLSSTGVSPVSAHRISQRVLIAPGVGGDSRRAWGTKNFLAVASALRTRGATITWLEGPGDAAYFDELPPTETRLRFDAHELPPLVEQLRQTDLFLCHDTAYVHLAAGLGVPTVAIYGAGQHTRFHPVGGRVKIVQSQIACAGCQWHCLWDRLVCVTDMPVETVIAAATQTLAGDTSPVTVPLASPVAHAPDGELVALKRRLQDEVLTLNADRFARLQIIQSLIAQQQQAAVAPPSAPPPPPTAEPKLSVIIPMGRPERVEPTLASFSHQERTPAHWEIILVGIGADFVARAHPQLPIVPVVLERNVLPPRTRCLGVERATGDWFLFCDDDVELQPDLYARFLELLTAPMFTRDAAHPVGAIGFRLPGKKGTFFEGLTDISNFWAQQHNTAEDRDWLYSASFLIRADAYRKSGGFNPDLPNGEDVDLTRRIAAQGYRLRYEPSLVASHDHRRDTLLSMWRYFWRNGNAARYFFATHGGACPFSVKTVWLKAWSDLRMNQDFQRARGLSLGWRTPLIWLNYLIVEASLDWHWQEYLHQDRRYQGLPTRAPSDETYVRALTAWDEGRSLRGAWGYFRAVLQDFGNPVRR